jgi:putative ABC transport system permease protein
VTDPALPLAAALAEKDGIFGAVADPALLTRLNLRPGARLAIGNATVELRAALLNEPDKLSSGIGFGPRVLISEAALQASGLIAPGSLARWQYRLRLPDDASDSAVAAVAQAAQAAFPDAGWEVRTRDKASPRLERSVARFMQFLTLVALTTLLVGGIGVANAVASHLAGKRDAIGTMKALGATGASVLAIYGAEIVLVALFAAALGAGIGAALPFAISHWLGLIIPLPVAPSLHPAVLALSVAYGLLTAFAFALWPLGRAHDVPVATLFRDQVAPKRRWPRARYIAATALSVAAFAALAILTTADHRIAAIFVASAAAILLLLRLFALMAMAAARRLPRARSTTLRLAIANTHRPGALTATVMLSLGLGLALLTTVIEIDGNLHREFTLGLPKNAPSFFLVDIASADASRFDGFVRAKAPGATLERVPMLRGRIVAANGIKAEDLKPAARSRWVLSGDRGITYAAAVPPGSRVVEGRWWRPDYSGEPLVSLEKNSAHDLNLKVGETITVNVLGRNVTARIANLRAVDWENLGINFIMVFSPGAFAGAPHSEIATLTFADGGTTAREAAFVEALARAFPTVSAIGVLAAGLIVERVMEFPFVLVAGPAAIAAGLALFVTLLFGLAGTFTALGRKPSVVLRNL